MPKYKLGHNIHSFKQDSVKFLYKMKRESRIQHNGIKDDDVEDNMEKSQNRYYETRTGSIRVKKIN